MGASWVPARAVTTAPLRMAESGSAGARLRRVRVHRDEHQVGAVHGEPAGGRVSRAVVLQQGVGEPLAQAARGRVVRHVHQHHHAAAVHHLGGGAVGALRLAGLAERGQRGAEAGVQRVLPAAGAGPAARPPWLPPAAASVWSGAGRRPTTS